MLPISTHSLSFEAIEQLVIDGGLRESKTLDFKRDQVGANEEAKREFLADVSALANTAGGDLVFGVDEAEGEASAVPGIVPGDVDKERLRLESVLRSGLQPRVPSVELKWLPSKEEGRGLLVVRVQRSFAAPHRVIANNKFFGRHSSGKYPLDVPELRSAFLSADTLVQSIRRFRLDRVLTIAANEGPFPLRSTARGVLHIVPLTSFGTRTDVIVGDRGAILLPLVTASGVRSRFSLDGFVTYPATESSEVLSYTLLFRSGAIEAAFTLDVGVEDGNQVLSATMLELRILSQFQNYMTALRVHHDIEPPCYVFLTLSGILGMCLPNEMCTFEQWPLARDELLLPEILITDAQGDLAIALRPIFDLLWNAFGRPGSPNYEQNGQRRR